MVVIVSVHTFICNIPCYSSPQAAKFLERDNSGKVELVYNEHLPAVTTPLSSDVRKPRTEIAVYPGFLTEGYRYMYEKLNEKSFGILIEFVAA